MQKGNKERVLAVIFLVVMALVVYPQAVAEELFDLQGMIDKAAEKGRKTAQCVWKREGMSSAQWI